MHDGDLLPLNLNKGDGPRIRRIREPELVAAILALHLAGEVVIPKANAILAFVSRGSSGSRLCQRPFGVYISLPFLYRIGEQTRSWRFLAFWRDLAVLAPRFSRAPGIWLRCHFGATAGAKNRAGGMCDTECGQEIDAGKKVLWRAMRRSRPTLETKNFTALPAVRRKWL